MFVFKRRFPYPNPMFPGDGMMILFDHKILGKGRRILRENVDFVGEYLGSTWMFPKIVVPPNHPL